MNKELIKRWVEALRSGKYQQGRLSLRNISNQFCCLGVLCDIAKDELSLDWILKEEWSKYSIDNSYSNIPFSVDKLLNIDTGHLGVITIDTIRLSPEYGVPLENRWTTLLELNDFYRLSFNQIADILEQQFLS
jgi:hypothetical protein